MRVMLVLMLAAFSLLLGTLMLRGGGDGNGPSPAAPRIVAIDFPERIAADGLEVAGAVRFEAPGGDLALAAFEVTEAAFFVPFEFDLQVAGQRAGAFPFYIATVVPQTVTLSVVLTDAEGRHSAPIRFAFRAVPAEQPSPAEPSGP